MYEYLVGVGILFLIWLFMFFLRKDLRQPMLWGSATYVGITIAGFILVWISFKAGFIEGLLVPDYWNPDTLFDLSRRTGGVSIEDIFFMFFAGGIATSVYEEIFGGRIKIKKSYKPHFRAIIIGGLISAGFSFIFKTNVMISLILFYFVGAVVLWIDRKDLIKHSLIGGGIFMVIYVLAFTIFNWIFPEFIHNFYNFNGILGIIILGLPIEEILYALGFGLLWAPLYEYWHGEGNAKR